MTATPEHRVATIGVYGFDGESFYTSSNRRTSACCSMYASVVAFVVAVCVGISLRLQAALAQEVSPISIIFSLRPTPSYASSSTLRRCSTRVGKRNRRDLATEYTKRFTAEILDRADLKPVVAVLPSEGTAALFASNATPSLSSLTRC